MSHGSDGFCGHRADESRPAQKSDQMSHGRAIKFDQMSHGLTARPKIYNMSHGPQKCDQMSPPQPNMSELNGSRTLLCRSRDVIAARRTSGGTAFQSRRTARARHEARERGTQTDFEGRFSLNQQQHETTGREIGPQSAPHATRTKYNTESRQEQIRNRVHALTAERYYLDSRFERVHVLTVER